MHCYAPATVAYYGADTYIQSYGLVIPRDDLQPGPIRPS